MSVPQHERWVELFEEAEQDPLPLWTRFGAATLPDTLFPRDYHTNPILVYFSRRKRWKEIADPWFLFLVGYPLLYPMCLLAMNAMAALYLMSMVLLMATVVLPFLAAVHARQFIGRRLSNVPFQELALTPLTPTEIAQALAVPPLADVRASVLLGIASFVIFTAVVSPAVGAGHAVLLIFTSLLTGIVFLILHARMTLFTGIVAVHVALTQNNWWQTIRRVWSSAMLLVGGLLVILASGMMCPCFAFVAVFLYVVLLKDRTSDVAHELWSEPEEWKVYKDEG